MKFTTTAAAVASLIPGIHGLTVNTPTGRSTRHSLVPLQRLV
jgi:hypothetical protein